MSVNNLVLIGNLVDAPEVSVTAAGTVRTRFRMASTERRRDVATDTWQDGDSVFLQVTCWRRLAENVGNSLEKGDRVIVSGRLRQWVAEKDGVRRTMHELDAEAVGPDLQRGVVRISRLRRPVAAVNSSGEQFANGEQPVNVEPPVNGNAEAATPGHPVADPLADPGADPFVIPVPAHDPPLAERQDPQSQDEAQFPAEGQFPDEPQDWAPSLAEAAS